MLSAWVMILISLANCKGKISTAQKNIISTTQFYNSDSSPKAPKDRRLLEHLAAANQKGRVSSRSASSSTTPPNSRDNSCKSDSSTKLPRSGYVVVLVGSERKRFIIPTNILNHRLFKLLVEKLGRDGCQNDETGTMVLPCNPDFLHRLLFLYDRWGHSHDEMRWEELKTFLDGN